MSRVHLTDKKILAAVCGVLLLAALWPVLKSLSPAMAIAEEASTERTGYLATEYTNGYYLAAGTGGRLNKILPDKHVETLAVPTSESLTDIWTDGVSVLVCGKNGTLLLGDEACNFTKCNVGISSDIFGVTCFNGTYYACAKKGTLLISENGTTWQKQKLPTDRDIVSIAANSSFIMAVTAKSDIFISNDGQSWKHDDFNKTYEGYYEARSFSKVHSLGNTFLIVGQLADKPGIPMLMYSDTGEVWIDNPLLIINGKAPENAYPLTINDICLDDDQILAVCDKSRLLTITGCAVCHQMARIADKELFTLSFGDGKLLVAGEDFYFDIIDSAEVRQDKISAEQALADFKNGAVIIDVRNDDELKESGYITGSIHIPLADIESALPKAVPGKQTELIFYCAKGVRAQKALETAQALGYVRVYNLGGLLDWPYGITK